MKPLLRGIWGAKPNRPRSQPGVFHDKPSEGRGVERRGFRSFGRQPQAQDRLITRKKSDVWSVYVVVGLVLAVAPVFSPLRLPLSVHAAGLLVAVLSLLPFAWWYARDRPGLPLFETLCLVHGICYSLPLYLVPNEINVGEVSGVLSWETTRKALLLTSLALAALMASYYSTMRLSGRISLPRVDLPLAPRRYGLYVGLSLVLGLFSKFVMTKVDRSGLSYSALLTLVSGQFAIGLILLAYRHYSATKAGLLSAAVMYGAVVAGAVLGLSQGSTGGAILPLVLLLVVRWHVRRRFPVSLAVVVVLAYLVFNPLKADYRQRVWRGGEGGGKTIAQMLIWWDIWQGMRTATPGLDATDGFRGSIERISLLHKFSWVLTKTPDEVPYFQGESYRYLLFTFVPRILWPGKPLANDAVDLVDFAYGFRSPGPDSQIAFFAIGQIAEAYANFAWLGMAGVMLLQGIFFALLDRIANGPESEGGRAIYFSVMVQFFSGIENSAVVLFGFILQYMIASALIMRPFALGFRRTSPPVPRRPRTGPGSSTRVGPPGTRAARSNCAPS
jgi:hypothetical protein